MSDTLDAKLSVNFYKSKLGTAYQRFVNLHFAAVQADTTEGASLTRIKKAWATSDAAQKEFRNMLEDIVATGVYKQ